MPVPDPDVDAVMETFARLREREKQRFRDERKGKIPTMDAETLRELCVDNEGYETPELNDNLYAHFRGFQKIEGLEPYYNLKALWLESNGLTKLENLTPLVSLRCLYLSKNLIERVENLECLRELNTLDLSENRIKTLAGIACLPLLSSLNLSRNLMESSDDLSELTKCSELTNIDVSHNQINDTSVLEVFKAIPKLRALRITGNEVVSKTKYFRKVYISSMPDLAFLDRPIFPVERTSVEAWARGGNDAELEAKRAFVNKEHADRKRDLQEFRDWQAQVRERRIREIAEEQARQAEQEKDQQPETAESPLREDDVDLRGFRGITKQEYIKLSPADRAVWDERIEAAHIESQRVRSQVIGDGVAKIGSNFWATEKLQEIERGGEKKVVSVLVEEPPPNVVAFMESAAPPLMPPPAPTLLAMSPPIAVDLPPSEALSSRALLLSSDEFSDQTPPEAATPRPVSMTATIEPRSSDAPTPSMDAESAEPATTEPKVFHRDPVKFFSEVGDTRRSWAELEQRAREAPFLHRPATLPSVADHAQEEEDDDNDNAVDTSSDVQTSATCVGGFPIRALTRDEIMRELGVRPADRQPAPRTQSSAAAATSLMPPPPPVHVHASTSAPPAADASSFTNVSALD